MTNATFNPANVLLSDALTGKIPTENGGIIAQDVMQTSAVMQLARYEEMKALEKTFMYLAEGPGAYWVGEGEKIKTSKASWLPIKMTAKKLGVILPVSKEFLTFTVKDFFDAMQANIGEAFRMKFDQAALFGNESPYETGISVFERATSSSNLITATSSLYTDINDTMAMVENGDNNPNAIATTRSINHKLRGTLDKNGLPIFNEVTGTNVTTVLGMPISYAGAKSWDKSKADILIGDWNQAVYGIPQGIEYEVSSDATLSTVVGEDNAPINLFERDLIALKATMYIAFTTIKEDAFGAIVPSPSGVV